jgi:hypothetical protein
MQMDCRGLAITTSSADAARNIDQAVKSYMDYGTTAGSGIKTALENDPACVLALCIRGYFFLMLENKALLPRVKQTLGKSSASRAAESASARQGLSVGCNDCWRCARWKKIPVAARPALKAHPDVLHRAAGHAIGCGKRPRRVSKGSRIWLRAGMRLQHGKCGYEK